MSSTIGPRDEGTAIAIGLVPSTGRMPPGGATSGELDAEWIATRPLFGDHLNIVGAAPAHPGVGHRNERNAVSRSFLDRRLRRVKERKHADIVAAVKSKRNLGLSQHLHGSAWQPEVFALEHVEDLGQARILIAAHGGINHVVGNDARLIVMISDAA